MKIRFAQLYAAHAAFDRYAAIIVSKTTRGGDNPLRDESAAILIAENRVQSGGGSLPHSSHDAAIIVKKSSKNASYAGEINFFVENQNRYCAAFVEYVFSAWVRRLGTNTNPNADHALSPLPCGQTSENNQM